MAHTCRDDVLAALERLEFRDARRVFRLAENVAEVKAAGSRCRDSTIRTHIGSRMCGNAPDHHAVVYYDLIRVSPGEYRRA
jgi:hypothetical protein